LVDPEVDGRIIFTESQVTELKVGLDLTGSGYDPIASFCEHSDEPPGSKSRKFLHQLSNCQLFNKGPFTGQLRRNRTRPFVKSQCLNTN
jgi:hypothetical protein